MTQPMTQPGEYADIQGNILRGYGYDHAAHLLLNAPSTGAARNCLTKIVDDVTTGALLEETVFQARRTLNAAVTFSGLQVLGVPDVWLEGLPLAFREATRSRAEQLGDVGQSSPEHWTSGEDLGTGEVHLMLSVHAVTQEELHLEVARLRDLVEGSGLLVKAHHEGEKLHAAREHFGFADGFAQPDIEGVPNGRRRRTAGPGGGVPLPGGGWRELRLGEFVLGYPDEDGQTNDVAAPALLRNGTYLVYRQLHQDVALFRRGLAAASRLTGLDEELLAAKIVGRWRDGTPLVLHPHREGTEDLADREIEYPPNDFRFVPHDREGYLCPVGAHIRRTNPRDALDFEGTVPFSGALTARHRIIRRGMPYGPPLPKGMLEDDGAPRGLLFLCFNADIGRQFETVQALWCNDGDTFGLGDDRDYLLSGTGGTGKMTIPVRGSRPNYILSQEGLVVTRGAEYFLTPGIAALRLLARGDF